MRACSFFDSLAAGGSQPAVSLQRQGIRSDSEGGGNRTGCIPRDSGGETDPSLKQRKSITQWLHMHTLFNHIY